VADVLDTLTGTMRRLSAGGGSEWWAASRGPALDGPATFVAFSSSHPVSPRDLTSDEDLFISSLPARTSHH
jgi:hypothetical protein